MTREFLASNIVLIGVQAAAVALPRAHSVPVLERLAERLRSPWWALVPLLSIAGVVWAINAQSGTADVLTWVALLAIPPLAAAALGWTMHGGRPWLAPLAAVLFLVAWQAQEHLAGELAGTLLSGLSCVTLGVLLVTVAPHGWLKVGIVLMAVADVILIGAETLQPASAVLNAAAPPAELPQLQRAHFGHAVIGYGDYFIAGVFGALLAAEGRRQGRIALLVFGLSLAYDALFLVLDTLPATVPVAVALLITEATARRRLPPPRRPRRLSRPGARSA
ncbi:hypothetical protein VSS74_18215 [Conexibacter stalactiti]|uniref:Uncharacterized protein n=1 Tax=Conexibacter stalactiti TaxID=1940611 RepID=A0ABU4HSI9_9ACTN|nr:hypothetical protein [Conexibacter stalactiti]MDW5596288.1 hypothetical protein [Conexibacter stalactiti]MEC5036930.1 hypothetical protein [Conexibacter stalactiti]